MTQNIFITGVTSGFGLAIVEQLAPLHDEKGIFKYHIYGVARRTNKLQQLEHRFQNFSGINLDLTDLEKLNSKIKTFLTTVNVDILINNAGLALNLVNYEEQEWDDLMTMIQTNMIAPSKIIHLVLKQMRKRNHGYLINISSIAGSYAYPGGNMYGATKAFLTQLSANLRSDLVGSNIRVTNIEPGLCGDTEFSHVRFKGDLDKVNSTYANVEYIKPTDIADIIKFLIEQPHYVNISKLEVMPVAQAHGALNVFRKNKAK